MNFVQRVLKVGLPVLLVALTAWIAYINLPRPQYAYSTLHPAATDVREPGESTAVRLIVQHKSETHRFPFQIGVVYSPGYLINVGGLEQMHPFDIKKYQKIHDALVKNNLLTQERTLSPQPLSREDLLLIHSQAYLDALTVRANVARYLEAPILQLAPVSLDTAILQPFRHASGGTLLAARQALISGIGINIGGGYHHAKPNKGEGFCLYADVPIAIRRLQKEGAIARAVIVDVDVHQGNGTVKCLTGDETTFAFSMHQKNIYPIPKEKGDLDVELSPGLDDQQYMKVLAEHLPGVFDRASADICFIVGGCDTLNGDPLASMKMTHQGIVQRDQMIVDQCVKRNLPVVLTLSGGYSVDAWRAQYLSIKNLIERQSLDEKTEVKTTQPSELK